MVQYTVPYFPRQVESLAVVLDTVDHPQALLVMLESARQQFVEHLFPDMAEWSVTQVVAEGYSLSQVLVQRKCPRDGPGYL